jgi:hypothetical protein
MAIRKSSVPYAERKPARPIDTSGYQDVSQPNAGFFRFKLGGGTIAGGVRIWHGPPHDPVTGEEMDRSWRWQAEFNGEPIPFERVWPACTGSPITDEEYRRYIARQQWARENAPDSAFAERGRRRDPLSLNEPLPF